MTSASAAEQVASTEVVAEGAVDARYAQNQTSYSMTRMDSMSHSLDNSHALRSAFEAQVQDLGLYTHSFQRHTEDSAGAENATSGRDQPVVAGDYVSLFMQDAWKIYRAFHISLVTKPEPVKHVTRYDGGMSLGGQSVVKGTDFDQERTLRLAAEAELESLKASYQTVHESLTSVRNERDRAAMEVGNLQSDLEHEKRQSNILEIGLENFDRLINLQKKQASMAEKALVAAQEAVRICIETSSVGPRYIERLELILAGCHEAATLLAMANRLPERPQNGTPVG